MTIHFCYMFPLKVTLFFIVITAVSRLVALNATKKKRMIFMSGVFGRPIYLHMLDYEPLRRRFMSLQHQN